jgi:multidrug efflux pump subunit AcrB
MTSSKSENKSIELVFPRPKREMDVYLPKVKGVGFFQLFSVDVQDIAKWFNEYEMDSMELKIESIINSPETETTKIILGSKGENNSALAVILKPKKANGSSSNYNYANQPQVPSDHVG